MTSTREQESLAEPKLLRTDSRAPGVGIAGGWEAGKPSGGSAERRRLPVESLRLDRRQGQAQTAERALAPVGVSGFPELGISLLLGLEGNLCGHRLAVLVSQMPVSLHSQSATVLVAQPARYGWDIDTAFNAAGRE